MNTTNIESVIFVTVPHQGKVTAHAFEDSAALTAWLRANNKSGSYCRYTAAEWDESWDHAIDPDCGDPVGHRYYMRGKVLFDAGAEYIVETCTSSEPELFAPADAPSEEQFLFERETHDYHAAYVLTREAAIRALATGSTGVRHQEIEQIGVISEAAKALGWT